MAASTRVLLLFNQDYGSDDAGPREGEEARAGVQKTAAAVETALQALPGSEVVVAGLKEPRDLKLLLERDRNFDLAFNLCESLRGDPRYEMPVPVLLEQYGVAYTGSAPLALRQCLNKGVAKSRLESQGVPVPEGLAVATEEEAKRLTGPIPAMVKPARQDGSIGIAAASVCRDVAALHARCLYLIRDLREPALVERFVDGREFNVSVLGDLDPAVLPIAEIDFSGMPAGVPKIVTYDAKWSESSAEYLGTVPKFGTTDEALARRLRKAALGAFRALGLRDYARVDMRVDATGNPWVVDVNPNCDLSPDAGFPKAAKQAGMDYTRLVHTLVGIALERGKRDGNAPTAKRRPPLAP